MTTTDGTARERHLYELEASGWALWRWICLRGAGFPAERVLALAAPDVSAAIERLLELEARLRAARAQAIAALEAERATHAERTERHAIAKHLRRVRAGEAPGVTDGLSPAAVAAIEAFRAASLAHREGRAAAEQAFAAERPRLARALQDAARDPRFREALAWQNRLALHHAADALVRESEAEPAWKARKHERLIATYLQRYCTKNDSIGFFGPFGWARIGHGPAAIAVAPGPGLLAARTVYFEHWGIDALASALAQDPRLRPHLAPRRHPAVWLEGTTLHHPIDRTTELPPEFARLLEACDGRRTARELAARLVQDPALDLAGEDEVYELLEQLADQRAAIWTLEVPPHVEHPDRVLAALLEAVADAGAAAPALARLAELQAARDAVAQAAGDAEALDRELARLDEAFTRQAEAAPSRRAGETYAGRTLVYEDCRRDLELELGPAMIDRLAAPLSLLLASARWFTFTLARRYREALAAVHHDLARETGSPSVDFLRFWERASAHFSGSDRGTPPPLVAEVVAELQRRWAGLVGLEGAAFDRPRLDVAAAHLAPAVAAAFAAPCPGWPSARHHSPDVMIAAADADAIARGELLAILGELHVASATACAPVALRQHPRPHELAAALQHGRPVPVIDPVMPKEHAMRADGFSILDGDLDLELGATRSRRPRGQVLEAGALRVEAEAGALVVRTRDGAWFALEQLLDAALTGESLGRFKPLAPAPRCPRVTIDGLVVHRRSWRFEAAQLDFARLDDPLDRMLAARRWARAHQLPRFLFYRVPDETKPCYLDLDSPHYVDLLAHLARKAPELMASEMLPAIDSAWLPDREGARYACELRLVAVDPEPWRAAP